MNINETIKNRRIELKMTMNDVAKAVGVSEATVSRWESGDIANMRRDKIAKLAEVLHVSPAVIMGWEEVDKNIEPVKLSSSITIPVYGRVPAGTPIEAIEDVDEYIDVPAEFAKGGKKLFGLKVKGDSMYPKYLDGDIIVVREESDCESGQDCVVYVNGYDATLKKIIKKADHIILQPLNPEYEPIMYEYNDEEHPVNIAGVVVEIRRKV